MNSLDTVEAVMAIEEAFGIELLVHESGDIGSPHEMAHWLELRHGQTGVSSPTK